MKNILTVLLFCFIIENILSTKQSLTMKMMKVSKTKKDISTLKQKNLRKLEPTDINSQNQKLKLQLIQYKILHQKVIPHK